MSGMAIRAGRLILYAALLGAIFAPPATSAGYTKTAEACRKAGGTPDAKPYGSQGFWCETKGKDRECGRRKGDGRNDGCWYFDAQSGNCKLDRQAEQDGACDL